MTTESQTPRTDALAFAVYNMGITYAREHAESLARTLERELAEARAQAAYFRERLEVWQDANGHMADRFEAARVDNARLRGALTQIANSGDAYNDLRATARAALEVQS